MSKLEITSRVELQPSGSSPSRSSSLAISPVLSRKAVLSPSVDSQVNFTPVRDTRSGCEEVGLSYKNQDFRGILDLRWAREYER